jgi:YkoP domain
MSDKEPTKSLTAQARLASPVRQNRALHRHPWLAAAIDKLDKSLRRRNGVTEYTQSRTCLCRMQITRSDHDLLLGDGTRVRPGDRIINLHFWTEQVPLIPASGPTFAWARHVSRIFESSLQELAHHLSARADVDDIAAIRVSMALGSAARRDQVSRVLSRFGFEVAPRPQEPSLGERIHRYGENILISLMVLAHNPMTIRSDTLKRDRVALYLSRRSLERRYGNQ